jgi:hypothetical protein
LKLLNFDDKKGEIMKKHILIAAMALVASGAAMADNASGVWGGFTATATDGVVYLPNGAGGTTTVMGSTDSTGVNAADPLATPAVTKGDSYAGIAGYYTGVSGSAIPIIPPTGANTGFQTYNTIGGASTGLNDTSGIIAYGQALVPGGAVDLSGQSVSTGESSLVANTVTAKTTGASAGNATVIGGGNGSLANVQANGAAKADATNNGTGALLYNATAQGVNNSSSFVNTAAPTFGAFTGH